MGSKVSESIRNFIGEIKSVFESNRVTLSIILLYTLWEAAIAAIPYEYYWDIHFFVGMVRRMLHCLILPSLFLETYFAERKDKWKGICGYVIAFIASVVIAACGDLYIFTEAPAAEEDMPVQVLAILPEAVQEIIGPGGSRLKECVERFCGGVLFLLFVAVVYKCYKESKLPFVKYMTGVLGSTVKTIIIWRLLSWCGALVDWNVESHYLRSYYYDHTEWTQGRILVMDTFWMGPTEILIMGVYLGPKLLLALRTSKKV